MGYTPKPGYRWNPMLNYPRNAGCPCGSGKKFKKCHIGQVPPVIPTPEKLEEEAAKLRAKEAQNEEAKSMAT